MIENLNIFRRWVKTVDTGSPEDVEYVKAKAEVMSFLYEYLDNMKIHLRQRAVKYPKTSDQEKVYDKVLRTWTLCKTGTGYVSVTDVPERVTCKNCLEILSRQE